MIKVSVCYSSKSGQEFASCGLSDIELDSSLLADPTALRDKIAESYDLCEAMVKAQLGLTVAIAATPPDDIRPDERGYQAPPPVNPAVTRANQPAPSPVVAPPPAVPPPSNGRATYYGKGRNQDGPPTTGKQLRQWATKNGTLAFFEDFARKQNPPLPAYFGDWSDEWAKFAHATWLSVSIPPAGPVPTNGVAH